jgi:cytochrome c oxidase assembly factor CtaG
VHALQSLANALIRFGILWIPLLAIFGVPIWLILRAVVRRRRGQKPIEPTAE